MASATTQRLVNKKRRARRRKRAERCHGIPWHRWAWLLSKAVRY
jgi:hypothetical protein